MRREDWAGASARWAEYRGVFSEQPGGYERGTLALMNAGAVRGGGAGLRGGGGAFPERSVSYVRWADLASRREDWGTASRRLERVRAAFPEEVSGHVRGAEALLELGRLDEAEELAGEAKACFPEHVGGYVHLGEVSMRREDWAGASARWAEYRGVFSEQPGGYERGTLALMNAGRHEEAERVCGEAVERFPGAFGELRSVGGPCVAARGLGGGEPALGTGPGGLSGGGLGARARRRGTAGAGAAR